MSAPEVREVRPAAKSRRRYGIALGIVVFLVGAYTLVGFHAVPRFARSMAQDYVAKELGRKLSIDAVRFNPFTFEAVIEGLALREADDTPLVAFRSLRVNAQLASIWARGVVLKDVRLEAPVVNVLIRPDGTVNLAQLAPAPSQPAAAPKPDAPPPTVRIGNLAVEEGRVDFEDRSQHTPFKAAVEKIHFALADFRADVDYRNAFAFSAKTPADEQFEWDGTFTVQPLGSVGRVAIGNLRAHTLDDYLQEHLPLKLAAGTVTVAAEYSVRLNPTFDLDVRVPALAVRDLQVKERAPGASETPLSLAQVTATNIAYSYAASEAAVGQVEIIGAKVDVRREKDGTLNLLRLAGPTAPAADARGDKAAQPQAGKAPTAQPPQAAKPQKQFVARVESLRLVDAALDVEDRAVSPAVKIEVKPLALTVKGWSTDATAKFGVEGDLTINRTGRVQVKGDTQLQPLAAQFDFTVRDLALPFLQPYFAPYTTLTLHSARLGANGKVGYAAGKDGAPAIRFAGGVDVGDLRTSVPPGSEDLMRWKALAVAGIDYSSAPAQLAIERVTLTQAYAKVVIAPDRTVNVAQVVREQGDGKGVAKADAATKTEAPTAMAAKSRQAPVMPIRVRQVRVVDGSANFADNSIEPNFAAGILGLQGSIDGLSSDPASRAKVKLEGKVDKYAPVEIGGELNLLAATKYTDVALAFRNMELTAFNPYSGKFAGYNISKGKLTTELRYKIEDRALSAEHHVIVDNLEFGEKTDSKDAAPIPVKLAVALLKDRKGVIDLQLPVRGSLDDPQFQLGPIIWKAVLGLLTKIVTAPFAAIGALFGGGDELAFVDFPAGAATLPPPEQAKLDKLATALIERPQLRLDVPHAAAERDGEALARAALDQRVAPGPAAADPAAAKRVRVAQLENLYKTLAKAAPAYPPETQAKDGVDVDARLGFIEGAVLEKLRPDKAALEALGRQRAQLVQDTLLAKKEIDPQRVFLTTERKAAATPQGAVRMELKLE